MEPWIIILEPQNMKVSQLMTFKHISLEPAEKGLGPQPNKANNAPVPVELSIAAREITMDGKVVYPSSKGSDDFVIYPSQFILYPGDVKKVQVQWVGTTIPAREIAFGIISTELPLKVGGSQDQSKGVRGLVKVVSRYEGIIVVRPKAAAPSVVVDSVYSRTDSGVTLMGLILNNKGTGMQNLKGMTLSINPLDKDGKIAFSGKSAITPNLSPETVQKSLFAGYRRRVEFPWPKEIAVAPVNVNVAFPQQGN